ncbi:flagellar basal body P-ring formation chaperone FlgA [Maritalea sp.]|jgi:flagella basal body P-ring formation protein FlgA|uniref:flagellar basal body P-ring formation chaperone FlgA n=1 Tax=Maritalea sp. TaxID=2003361 RepID=UPI0039E5A73C
MFRFTRSLIIGLIAASVGVYASLGVNASFAAPTLRPSIIVTSNIVTVGDMFEDAGNLAEIGLFRSPTPGTVGAVPLASIKLAAQRAGLGQFDTVGITHVRVERPGIAIDQDFLSSIFSQEIAARGQLLANQEVKFAPYGKFATAYADPTAASPVTLLDFTYEPQTGRVSARLALAGYTSPISIIGKLEILAPAAHLTRTMAKGEVIDLNDIEFKPVPVRFSKTQGDMQLPDLVGKSLTRAVRGGAMVKVSDLSEPILINRNEQVTILYRSGQLKLTVKGQALNSATQNQMVSVLNLMSKRTIQGIAIGAGTVLITNDPTRLASR